MDGKMYRWIVGWVDGWMFVEDLKVLCFTQISLLLTGPFAWTIADG